ncbi:hypothetical protein BKA83DRAFT_18998 [Pisolithus microcarpus]|nr:hypothetical protein BKA83DRAFT_18998 [Pisolithus microcarpus]
MDSHFETGYGYPSDADAECAVDEEGEESAIGEEQPDGPFNIAELEILARRRREWMQARKKEKPVILREIYKEFAKLEKNHDLRPVERREKEEQITAWLKKPLRTRKPHITVRSAYKYSVRSVVWEIYHEQIQEKHAHMKNEDTSQGNNQRIDLYQQALTAFIRDDLTEEQLQAARDITEKWNGPEGPSAEVQARNAKKYALKFMKNFAEEMWRYCGMRMVSLTGWKDSDGAVQACCMDFNSDIAGGSTFNDVHTLDANWRDYLGAAYENPDVAGGDEVPNIAASHPRAKKGDPIELVTNNDGEIWIGDLRGQSHDSILQMVQGYLTAHYRRACRRRSATVPFKKLGRYQAEMIASHHLPENFSFTVDPSHMRISAAMELLNFWREQQITNPNDVFSFQKWLDQSGNLQEPYDRSTKPLEVARKRKCQSREPQTSADGSTADEDGDPDNEYDGTSSRPPLSNESMRTSRVTSRPRKKTPMPRKVPSHTTDDDGQNSTDGEDLASNANTNLPVLAKPKKQNQPAIQKKALPVKSVLEDASEYPDSDGFESIPFTDYHTAKPGPSSQHRINGKLKSALKQIPRSELCHMDQAPENQRINGDSSTSKPHHRKPNQTKGTTSGADNDQDHIGLPAEEVDVLTISPQQKYVSSSAQPEEMDSSSSQTRMVSKNCPSMEALSLYGEESPSPPNEMSTALQPPSPTSHLSFFERMKRAQVPKPLSPQHTRVPSAEQDVAMAAAESLGDTMVRPPLPTLNLSLFERMNRAEVPKPPSPAEAKVPSPQEVAAMELAESSGDTTVCSPSPTPNLSLFERMKCAQVPKPPSPVPASQMDLFERMRRAPVPPPPSPSAAAKVDTLQTLQSVEVPSPLSPFEELHIEQGGEPDRSRRIDFGDPDRGQLRDFFKHGLTGPLLTADERRDLERAGLANADTEEDVLRSLHHFKSRHVGPPSARSYAYNKNLDLHITRAMKRIGADIQQLVKNRVKFMHLGQYTIDTIDLLEVSRYPHAGDDVQPYTGGPPYPSRQSVIEMAIIYWGLRIECTVIHLLGMPAFHMIDTLGHYVPDWTPRSPNKYIGFIFPWWLHGSSQYPTDFEQLRGGRIFPIADEYFQYKWPTEKSSMGDQIDNWIAGQVHNYMRSLREIAEEIEVNERNVNHLFSRWATLSGLLGMQDLA